MHIYYSALHHTALFRTYDEFEPRMVEVFGDIKKGWSAMIAVLSGHNDSVWDIAFSQDSPRRRRTKWYSCGMPKRELTLPMGESQNGQIHDILGARLKTRLSVFRQNGVHGMAKWELPLQCPRTKQYACGIAKQELSLLPSRGIPTRPCP
jgi:hypothetical protein